MKLRSVRLKDDCSTFWQPLKKNALQERDSAQKKAVQARISGQKNRRERNHRLFLAAGLMIDAGLVDTKTGELNFDHEKLLTALKRVRYDLETSA
jgi:hypothetical protein